MTRVALDRKISDPGVFTGLIPRKAQESQRDATEWTRRAGASLGVAGMLLLTFSAGDVLAGVAPGTDRGGELRGSERGEVIHGTGAPEIIYGLSGNDEVYGGKAEDVMLGGPGDDFIEAKDGAGDFVGCGAGHDVASVDEKDIVSRDCEIVYRA